jgi:hypothetical protein
LLIGVHTRKDFDIIWIKHVAGGHWENAGCLSVQEIVATSSRMKISS